jgi:hypothetical protein
MPGLVRKIRFMGMLITSIGVLAFISAFAGGGASGAEASALRTTTPRSHAPASSRCSFSVNLYSVRRSRLTKCGYRYFPVEHIALLPGGGRAYYYKVYGEKVEMPVPPSGFDPLTASVAELNRYGMPLPSEIGRAEFVKVMGHVRFTRRSAPPKELIVGPLQTVSRARRARVATPPRVAGSSPPNDNGLDYAGYVVYGETDYNYVSAAWTEPKISADSCGPPAAEANWVGLGTGDTYPLAQAGTSFGVQGNHAVWSELIIDATQYAPVYAGWDASPGDPMYAEMTWDMAKPDNYEYYVSDPNITASPLDVVAYSSNPPGNGALVIVEEPPGNYYLANFGSVTFTGAYAGTGTTSTHTAPLGDWDNELLNMSDGTQNMTDTTALSEDGQVFTVNDKHCS